MFITKSNVGSGKIQALAYSNKIGKWKLTNSLYSGICKKNVIDTEDFLKFFADLLHWKVPFLTEKLAQIHLIASKTICKRSVFVKAEITKGVVKLWCHWGLNYWKYTCDSNRDIM